MKIKNKFNEVAVTDDQTVIDQVEETLNSISDNLNSEIEKPKPNIHVIANFSTEITEIGYIFLATGEQNVVTISNGSIHLLQGRQYYIPVGKTDINSDEYNIKVHSDISDRIDVRYVKDGFAAIIPIRHNCILKTGEKLCILFPLNS